MSYVEKLDAMSNDFKEYVKKYNIQKPDALTLVSFLREKNFTDAEIESTFAELGYPIDTGNLDVLDPNNEQAENEKQQAVAKIMSYVKKMNKPTLAVFLDILKGYVQQKKHNEPKEEPAPTDEQQPKKKKPHVKLKSTVESALVAANKKYIFESHSTVTENAVSSNNAEKILNIAADSGKLKISKKNLFNIWKKSYSGSTDIQDLNRLISRAGIKMMPALRIAKQHNIPVAKDSDMDYAETVANIVIEYGLAEEVLAAIQKKFKLKENTTRQQNVYMSESDIRRTLAEMLINENKKYMT